MPIKLRGSSCKPHLKIGQTSNYLAHLCSPKELGLLFLKSLRSGITKVLESRKLSGFQAKGRLLGGEASSGRIKIPFNSVVKSDERKSWTVAQAIPLKSTLIRHQQDRIEIRGGARSFLAEVAGASWLAEGLLQRRKLANCL